MIGIVAGVVVLLLLVAGVVYKRRIDARNSQTLTTTADLGSSKTLPAPSATSATYGV